MISFIEVCARVRYWEDATVNGVEDTNGDLIPCREGDTWHIIIDSYAGRIKNWPIGTTARVHYKVCDAGTYYLLNEDGIRLYKEKNYYVPDFLSIGENGCGDYIILDIDENGMIDNWKKPIFKTDDYVNLVDLKSDVIE